MEVTIGDVNDNPPVFAESSYVGQLIEHSPMGTEVSVVSLQFINAMEKIH